MGAAQGPPSKWAHDTEQMPVPALRSGSLQATQSLPISLSRWGPPGPYPPVFLSLALYTTP